MARGKQRKGTPSTPTSSGSPAMAEAWRLFEAGDKHLARTKAKALLAQSTSDSERAEAQDLIDRTRLPRFPLIVAGVFSAIALLLILLAVIRY